MIRVADGQMIRGADGQMIRGWGAKKTKVKR